jgi:hypothetical protein
VTPAPLHIRLTDHQHAELEQLAKNEGLSKSEFVRKAIFERAESRDRMDKLESRLAQLEEMAS